VGLDPLPPGVRPALTDDEARVPGAPPKGELRDELDRLGERLARLQAALYAEAKRALLVVLQGRDAAGKDGAIRRVFGAVNPLGLRITSFKAPTPVELAHDFLWRVHHRVPPRGLIGVFNRSHYEDVLVVRVHGLVPEPVWRARYEQINAFERHLSENDVAIAKFFLHVSRAEQRKRLLARLADPEKNWKFDAQDVEERKRWDAYTEAYRDVLALTNTAWAPWYVVPADRKPVRDALVAGAVVEILERLAPGFPPARPDAERLRRLLEEET